MLAIVQIATNYTMLLTREYIKAPTSECIKADLVQFSNVAPASLSQAVQNLLSEKSSRKVHVSFKRTCSATEASMSKNLGIATVSIMQCTKTLMTDCKDAWSD